MAEENSEMMLAVNNMTNGKPEYFHEKPQYTFGIVKPTSEMPNFTIFNNTSEVSDFLSMLQGVKEIPDILSSDSLIQNDGSASGHDLCNSFELNITNDIQPNQTVSTEKKRKPTASSNQ